MPYASHDSRLTPDQRRREIAAILARGVLRLRDTRQVAPKLGAGLSHDPPEWPQKGLEVSGTSRPHVDRG